MGRNMRRRRAATLRSGVAHVAFIATSALSASILLPQQAAAQTTLPATTNPVYLATYPNGNPFTINSGTTIDTTSSYGTFAAIVGNNSNNWSLTNSGVVNGESTGVFLQSQSFVSNAGTITGQFNGILFSGGAGTLTNSGTITGTYGYGVRLGNGGSVNNQTGGLISGFSAGIYVSGGGTIINAGTITGYAHGVTFGSGGTASITNTGTITASGVSGSSGIRLLNGGYVLNQGGFIAGGNTGVYAAGAAATITNSGTIVGTSGVGALLNAGGSIVNQASGMFAGSSAGISTSGAAARIVNSGTITGTGGSSAGIMLGAGGAVSNGGTISGGAFGVYTSGAAATVTNSGTISGGTAAVSFNGTGANVLTLETGGVLSGTVLGSTASGATNTLVLQGTGALVNSFQNFQQLNVAASGSWTINGTQTFGATAISSGALVVGDAAHAGAVLASAVTLTGGTLSGHGTILGSIVNQGGTVSPGGTIGNLTVNGNFTQGPGGTLAIEVNPSGASSKLIVNGNATVGGTLLLLPDPGTFTNGTRFTFLVPSGTVSGEFANVTDTAPGLQFALSGGQTSVILLSGGTGSLSGIFNAVTPNQQAVANALLANGGGGGDVGTVLGAVAGLPSAQQPQALDQLGGEIYAPALTMARDGMRNFLTSMSYSLLTGVSGPAQTAAADSFALPSGIRVWGQGNGNFDNISGDGNAHAVSGSTGGFTLGVERDFGGDSTAGAALGYSHTSFSLSDLSQHGNLNQVGLGVYGEQRWGEWFVSGSGGLLYDDGSGTRQIMLPGLMRVANGGFNGFSGGLMATGGARFQLTPFALLEPSLSLLYSHVDQGSFVESGAGAADLASGGTGANQLQSRLGVRIADRMAVGGGVLEPEARAAWAHEFADLTPQLGESFPAIPGSGFTITGASPNRDAALLGVGVRYKTSSGLAVYADYEATVGQREIDHSVIAGLKFTW